MSINLDIDMEKCIKCGLCAKDCSACCIKMNENNEPVLNKQHEKYCLKCQHCLAICPVGALSVLDKKPENSEPVKNLLNPDDLLNLIKSRRSIRTYKKENLDKERMEKLKEMLHWVPTGCNAHSLIFSFVEDIESMDEIRCYINKKLQDMMKKVPMIGALGLYKKAILDGEDVIFRGAPHCVVISAPITAPCVNVDPIIAGSYFELYAQSLGVGTLWCGFAEICFKLFPELCDKFEIPQGCKPVYVLLFGPSDLKYARAIQPEPYTIKTISKGSIKNINLIKRIKRMFYNR